METTTDTGLFASFAAGLDRITGVEGTVGYIAILALVVIGHSWMNSNARSRAAAETEQSKRRSEDTNEDDDASDPPQNFTAAQLRKFDGTDDNPLYLSVRGIVFDVSAARDFYGPGGPYEMFAGRECGVALAKMSFEESHLDDLEGCDSLMGGEKYELESWIEKFTHYRSYPVKGRLVPAGKLPSSDRVVSKDELVRNDGSGPVPEGYAAAPIYLGAGDRVYDVSFGGVAFYGPGCSYERFAGKNASRALAKMSFDPADTANTDVDDLSESERKVLADWIKTFEERKQYPCVGRIEE